MFGMLCTVSNLNNRQISPKTQTPCYKQDVHPHEVFYVLDNQKMIAKIPQTKSSGLGSFPIKIAHFIDKSRIKESALRQINVYTHTSIHETALSRGENQV